MSQRWVVWLYYVTKVGEGCTHPPQKLFGSSAGGCWLAAATHFGVPAPPLSCLPARLGPQVFDQVLVQPRDAREASDVFYRQVRRGQGMGRQAGRRLRAAGAMETCTNPLRCCVPALYCAVCLAGHGRRAADV